MQEFIDKLTLEQINYLEKIKKDFQEMTTEELDEWLSDYFQKQGLEDISNNKNQLILESILDVLGEI